MIELKSFCYTANEVVEAKNNSYGAFDIRKKYEKIALKALGIAIASSLTALGSPMILSHFGGEELVVYKPTKYQFDTTVVELQDIEQPRPAMPDVPPPPPAATTAMQRFVPFEVTPDHVVDPKDAPPSQEDLQNVVIGNQTVEGEPGDFNLIVEDQQPGGTSEIIGATESNEPFVVVEHLPDYPGGQAEMMKFLRKKLRYPDAALKTETQGAVYVQFVVEKDGSITDVKVVRGLGQGCDEEAVRVIKQMPDWSPGKQSGRAVRVRYTLPIRFQLSQ